MTKSAYSSMNRYLELDRRDFFKGLGVGTLAVGSLVLGLPAQANEAKPKKKKVETNLADFMKVPKGKYAIPGPFPGKVVQLTDPKSVAGGKFDLKVIGEMLKKGISGLTGKNLKDSFNMFFTKSDIVGLKVNPVGPPLISTRLEVVEAVIKWLVDAGLPKKNIVIWDRFDYMLKDAGFTAKRFPGVQIEGLQTMGRDGGPWRDKSGKHVSLGNFDKNAFYYAKGITGKSVRGYKDDESYLNQHVFNGEYSYFGKLVTQKLTKIVNLPVFKNTGHGISMATKNLGYAVPCNTGRLHAPLFFRVCTEVLAAPTIRDKLVLNITDGLRGQADGGPMPNEQFVFDHHTLYFATDPFAIDMVCHTQLVAQRKKMKIQVNEHPRFTEYLRDAEKLGLGVVNQKKLNHIILKS
jgi:uncharacterized protein DUF362